MIADKLNELGEFAEDLEKEDPLDLLNFYFSKKIGELEDIPDYQIKIRDDFGKELHKIIQNYDSKNLLSTQISYQLLIVLVDFIKKSMVEEKANFLGVEKTLFKQQMKLLFKGKWK